MTAAPWRLRPAVTADLPAIAAIYRHHVLQGVASFEEVAPDLAEMARRYAALASAGYPYLVADGDGRVLGYAYAGVYRPRSAYRFTVEDSLYLDPVACGQGLGTALLGHLIEACTARGFRQMVAAIGDSGNAASIGLHAKLGFRAVGCFQAVGFKAGRWLDSVLMQRPLGEGATTMPAPGGR